MEQYFKKFRDNIIGIEQVFESPFGLKKIVYADWTASGRMYKPLKKYSTGRFSVLLQILIPRLPLRAKP